MATKTITGTYPSGYYLDPSYQTLNIASSANVGGAGVTTSAAQASTISNLGSVQGSTNGITLSNGGTIMNGVSGASSQTASIQGVTAIVANGSAATVANYARITSDSIVSGTTTTTGPGVVLNAGGKVTNTGPDAVISNGISIAGAVGEVVNRSRIGGVVTYQYQEYDRHQTNYGPSVALAAGGSVNNGANGTTNASLSNGVSISGGLGSIINNGTIGGQATTFYYKPRGDYGRSSFAIILSGGGTIRNGTGGNRVATISSGISISGGTGTIDNQGKIISVDPRGPSYAINMTGGGNIVNGRVNNDSATIEGFSAGISLRGKGSIQNFGTISAKAYAVILRSSDQTLIQEGTGVLDGRVLGGGGTFILGADAGVGSISGVGRAITGFGQINVAAGATWTLNGSILVEAGTRADGQAGTLFKNQGNLTASASLENNGFFQNEGTFTSSSNVKNNGVFSVYGTTTINGFKNGANGSLDFYDDGLLTARRVVNSGRIATTSTSQGQIAGDVLNLGSMSGSLKIEGRITGSGGVLVVGRNQTMELTDSVASGQRVTFADPQATLVLDQSSKFQGVISGFTHGDRIDLADVLRAGATLSFTENDSDTKGVLTIKNGSTEVALTLRGNYAASRFRLMKSEDGNAVIGYASTATRVSSSRIAADPMMNNLGQSLFEAAFEPCGSASIRTCELGSLLTGQVAETDGSNVYDTAIQKNLLSHDG